MKSCTVGLVIFAVENFAVSLFNVRILSTLRGFIFSQLEGLSKLPHTGCALNRVLVTNKLESEALAVGLSSRMQPLLDIAMY